MNVEYINPFIEASRSVLKDIIDYNVQLGKVYVRNSSFSADEILIIIGLTGKMRGQVMISMSKSTMLDIASKMMLKMIGQGVDEINELAISAISELSNMILGNASTILSKKGICIDISPPSMLIGKAMEISSKDKTICIPLTVNNDGLIEINVSTEEK